MFLTCVSVKAVHADNPSESSTKSAIVLLFLILVLAGAVDFRAGVRPQDPQHIRVWREMYGLLFVNRCDLRNPWIMPSAPAPAAADCACRLIDLPPLEETHSCLRSHLRPLWRSADRCPQAH